MHSTWSLAIGDSHLDREESVSNTVCVIYYNSVFTLLILECTQITCFMSSALKKLMQCSIRSNGIRPIGILMSDLSARLTPVRGSSTLSSLLL